MKHTKPALLFPADVLLRMSIGWKAARSFLEWDCDFKQLLILSGFQQASDGKFGN